MNLYQLHTQAEETANKKAHVMHLEDLQKRMLRHCEAIGEILADRNFENENYVEKLKKACTDMQAFLEDLDEELAIEKRAIRYLGGLE